MNEVEGGRAEGRNARARDKGMPGTGMRKIEHDRRAESAEGPRMVQKKNEVEKNEHAERSRAGGAEDWKKY